MQYVEDAAPADELFQQLLSTFYLTFKDFEYTVHCTNIFKPADVGRKVIQYRQSWAPEAMKQCHEVLKAVNFFDSVNASSLHCFFWP
jgi:hypothetical protein